MMIKKYIITYLLLKCYLNIIKIINNTCFITTLFFVSVFSVFPSLALLKNKGVEAGAECSMICRNSLIVR